VTAVNGARGEIAATLGGEPARLCLTLGALAEIETALGLEEGGRLSERLARVGARDVTLVLEALLRGGGLGEAEAARAAARATPGEGARAVADAFRAAAQA